jgi:uncharacterized protein YodC (DUF2158 family)
MTVQEFSDKGVKCRWFEKSKLQTALFASEELEAASSSRLTINMHLDNPASS